jgi:hypothetical protein
LGPFRRRRTDYDDKCDHDYDANYHIDVAGRRRGKFDESSWLLDE